VSVSAGVDYNFTASSATSGLDRRAATLHGTGATAVVAVWGLSSDKLTSDTVDLSADLTSAAASTPTAKLTSSLAQLIKGASYIDPTTGAREINQGISDTLASQVGHLLVGSGFSQADATKASASLVQQFASASSGTNILALSLANQNQTTGNYTASVAGGQEVSAWSVQSTTTLNVAFDLGSGNLSVKLDQHKVAATRIEWFSSTASNVSIALTQSELEAISFTPDSATSNPTGSPVRESEVATTQNDPHSFVGSGNIIGPNGFSSFLRLEGKVNTPSSPQERSATPTGNSGGNIPTSPSSSSPAAQSPAEIAILALKKLVEQVRSAYPAQDRSASRSVNLTITQQIGAAGTDQSGSKFLFYNRPIGSVAIIGVPGVRIQA